jgi:1-aminocyclopropane-1-carboxylate deaminase/D-cysteine desulfhydrase-like pyridoxal-dependent ACC family enzyme
MTAAYAAAEGMQAHLVLGGTAPGQLTGNLLLDHLLGAQCHYTGTDDWDVYNKRSIELERELIRKGRKVYRLPMGGSTPIGSLGYIEAMAEIMEDEKRFGLKFDTIVFASSSAGTQAGLIAGKTLAEWPGRLLGFSVARREKIHVNAVLELASQTAALFNVRIDPGSICIDDGYIGGGYALKTAACDEAVQFFARRCGIFLDHVYTGKAAAGLMDYLHSGKFAPGSTVLFLHTGGNIELFA